MVWVDAFPLWADALLIVGGMCAIAGAGLRLYLKRFGGDGTFTHNDVAGPIISTAGTVLAVMLSLMVVGVWQEYDQSSAAVAGEAAALADLARLSDALPPSSAREVRRAIRRYATAVVRVEWPLMRQGRSSDAARVFGQQLLLTVARLPSKTPVERGLFPMNLQLAREAIDGRRARLLANDQTIPPVLWIVMIVTGAITIVLSYFFRVKTFAVHLAMTLSLTAIIGCVFVLIAALDLPFRGDAQISPAAFTATFNALGGERPTIPGY